MPRTVLNVPIPGPGFFHVSLPEDAEPVSVQRLAGDMPVMCVLMDPAAPRVDRVFAVCKSNAVVPDGGRFVGSFVVESRIVGVPSLVAHVFEAVAEIAVRAEGPAVVAAPRAEAAS